MSWPPGRRAPGPARAGRGARLLLSAALAAACTDVGSDPSAVGSIEFTPLASPSIVAGDTLRDTTGRAVPLRAVVYNERGDVLDVPVQFLTPDTSVRVDPAGYVIARALSGRFPELRVRMIASAGGLQTTAASLDVVPSPDTVTTERSVDSLLYSFPETAANSTSPEFAVVVRHKASATDSAATVRSYLVTFRLSYRGTDLGPGDTTVAYLVDDVGRRSTVDTTGGDGRASRRVRVHPAALAAQTDTLIVSAVVRYRGQVPGSPARFILKLRPR